MQTRPFARGLTLLCSLLLLVLVCALVARSLWHPSAPAPVEEPAHSDDESEVQLAGTATPPVPVPRTRVATPDAPGAAGMVIGLDPETGTWGAPTREQLRELAEIRSRTEGDAHRVAKPEGWLPEVHHPDGHVSVDLNGQFQEFTTVRLGPDGKPVFTCVHGPEEAKRAAAEPAGPALEER